MDPTQYYEGGDSDPYCCETEWDDVCLFECMYACGYECALPEAPPKPPTFSHEYSFGQAGGTPLAAPLKSAMGPDGRVYLLDTVKSKVFVYELFAPTQE